MSVGYTSGAEPDSGLSTYGLPTQIGTLRLEYLPISPRPVTTRKTHSILLLYPLLRACFSES